MAQDISLPWDLLQINGMTWNLKVLSTFKWVFKKCGKCKNIVELRWYRSLTAEHIFRNNIILIPIWLWDFKFIL